MLKCECGEVLRLTQGYTGADWECKAGDKSGYGYEVSLKCDECGRIYTLGMTKDYNDFSEIISKSRCYK